MRKYLLLALVAAYVPYAAVCQVKTPSAKKTGKRAQQSEPTIAPEVLQAEEAIANNDLSLAEKLLTAATARDPQDHRAWYDLGFVYRRSSRAGEAVSAYKSAIASKPNLAEAYREIGLLLSQSQPSESAEYLRKAVALKPDATNWIALGEALQQISPAEAVDAFRQASALDPNEDLHVRAGRILEKQGKPAEAEAEYKAALGIGSGSTEAAEWLADLQLRQQRFVEAEAVLRAALQRSPQASQARLRLAQALYEQKKLDEAARELDTLVAGNSDDTLMREAAALYGAAGRTAKAVELYRTLLKKSRNDADLHYRLGKALYADGSYTEAEPEFIAALQLDPKLVEAYGNLAVSAQANKRHELAIKVLDVRAKLAPETPATFFLRATSYDHLRLYKQAAEYYHRFLESAGGKFPDQEWQARHRLLAIEPGSKDK